MGVLPGFSDLDNAATGRSEEKPARSFALASFGAVHRASILSLGMLPFSPSPHSRRLQIAVRVLVVLSFVVRIAAYDAYEVQCR